MDSNSSLLVVLNLIVGSECLLFGRDSGIVIIRSWLDSAPPLVSFRNETEVVGYRMAQEYDLSKRTSSRVQSKHKQTSAHPKMTNWASRT